MYSRFYSSYNLSIIKGEGEVLYMTVDTNTMISITDANKNFSKVTKLVDEHGSAVILKNNAPRYLVIDFSKADTDKLASTNDVLAASEMFLKRNRKVYEELAK